MSRCQAIRFGRCLTIGSVGARRIDCVPLSWYSCSVIFRVSPSSGKPVYLQIMEQVRHAVESGVLQDGDQMPSIRTLAEELVVSHNTIAKAYTELQHEGVLELRHGSGAFISTTRRMRARAEHVQRAQTTVVAVVQGLVEDGLTPEEIRRLFEVAVAGIEHPAGRSR